MTVELIPGSAVSCPDRNPKPRNRAMHKAACDAADADPNERRKVREFDVCALFSGMIVWYEGQFREVMRVERPMTPDITVHFVAPAGVSMSWFTKRTDPAYCLIDTVLVPC